MSVNNPTSNPAMLCLLEEMRDNPGAVSAYAAAGAAAWALGEIERLRVERNAYYLALHGDERG